MSDDRDHTYDSGAKRSAVKPLYAAIPSDSLRRVALRATGAPRGETNTAYTGFIYEGGSLKYGYRNWANGLPFEDTLNHLIEHLLLWKNDIELGRVPTDDHLSAVAWAVLLPLMTFEREYAAQYRARNAMVIEHANFSTKYDPAAIDSQMRATFKPYLLQQLAPVEPTPVAVAERYASAPNGLEWTHNQAAAPKPSSYSYNSNDTVNAPVPPPAYIPVNVDKSGYSTCPYCRGEVHVAAYSEHFRKCLSNPNNRR